MGLTLYKVQQGIYLLDFQRKEGDQFSFMTLCAMVISQLKILSATTKVTQVVNSDSMVGANLAAEVQHHGPSPHQLRLPPVHPVPLMSIPPYHRPNQPGQGAGDAYHAPPTRFPGGHGRRQEI